MFIKSNRCEVHSQESEQADRLSGEFISIYWRAPGGLRNSLKVRVKTVKWKPPTDLLGVPQAQNHLADNRAWDPTVNMPARDRSDGLLIVF